MLSSSRHVRQFLNQFYSYFYALAASRFCNQEKDVEFKTIHQVQCSSNDECVKFQAINNGELLPVIFIWIILNIGYMCICLIRTYLLPNPISGLDFVVRGCKSMIFTNGSTMANKANCGTGINPSLCYCQENLCNYSDFTYNLSLKFTCFSIILGIVFKILFESWS